VRKLKDGPGLRRTGTISFLPMGGRLNGRLQVGPMILLILSPSWMGQRQPRPRTLSRIAKSCNGRRVTSYRGMAFSSEADGAGRQESASMKKARQYGRRHVGGNPVK